MHIPSFVIMPVLLAAFGIASVNYYIGNPANRVTHPNFLVMAATMLLSFAYLLSRDLTQTDYSLAFLALAASCLAAALLLGWWMARSRATQRRRKQVADHIQH